MLTLDDVTVCYQQEISALQGFSVKFDTSETVALVGANGAGKSTLLSLLVGLVLPSKGTVKLDELVLSKKTLPQFRNQIGMIFQNPDDQLFMNTVLDEVTFGLLNQGVQTEQAERQALQMLEKLDVLPLRDRLSHRLSGGEKRRVALASVLVMQPKFLLFDEPTAFLDPRATRAFAALLPQIDGGKIIATHDLSFAKKVCNRVLLIKDGKLFAEGDLSLLDDETLLEGCGL